MSVDRFTWLHLTDLHVGLSDGDWLWPGVEEEMLHDLGRLHARIGPIDAVFFTGDLTQCGDKNEFERFDEVWGTVRKALERLGSKPVFIAVPGNHDLVRPSDGSAVLDGLRNWTADAELRRRFWTQDDGDYRRAVRQAFDPWTSWADSGIDWGRLENVQRNGLLPGDFAATLRKGGLTIGLLGLNTGALQLAGGDYRKRLSIHPRQASALVGKLYEWVAEHDACFVLTHHDPSWFDVDGLAAWNGEIAKPGRFVAHLCGHRHEQAHTLVVEGGAQPRRMVIGRSLFGLETYEHQGGRKERLHGYSIGMIEQGSSRSLRFWPRRDELQQAGHRELRADQSVTLEHDQGTPVEDLGPSRRPVLPSAPPSRSADPAEPTSPLPGWVEITTEFLNSRQQDLDDAALRLFYDGQEPRWAHAQLGDDRIPRREVVEKVVARLQNPAATALVLLVAAGGEGKSLVLRQAVVDLVEAGCRVLWREDDGFLVPDAVAALPSDGPWILASDDGEVVAGELEAALKKVQASGRRDVHWLIGARDTDWRTRFGRGRRAEPPWSRWATLWPRGDNRARSEALALTDADAARVVAAWTRAGTLGALEAVPEAERVRALMSAARKSRGVSNGTFFGAVLEERFGAEGLRAHLETVIQRLGDEDHAIGGGCTLRDAFLYAAAAEAVGIDGVDLKVVAELVGVERERRRPEILHRLGQEAVVAGGGDALRTRAPAIARVAVQLVEDGRIDDDMEETYRSLVRVTAEVGRDVDVGKTHGDILHCGRALVRELPHLGVNPARVSAIARVVANDAVALVPEWLGIVITQANTYRSTGDPQRGADILGPALLDRDAFDDWDRNVRVALYELGVCEGGASRLVQNIWVSGLSLADGPDLGRVTGERAKLSLAGLGAACLEIAKTRSLDDPFKKLLRATSVLGPGVTPNWDRRAGGYFQRHGKKANQLRVPRCSDKDALLWMAAAVEHAARQVDDPNLQDIAAALVNDPLSFRELRRTLGLRAAPDGPPSAGGSGSTSAPRRSQATTPQPGMPATPRAGPAPPTLQSRVSMTPLPRDLIAVLAEHYPDVRDARAVWVRAGGTNGEVENIPRPRDLWQAMWLHSTRGASVRPAALLRAALDDLPNNTVIIGQLRILADARAVDAASRLVEAIEAREDPLDQDGTLELLAEWEVVDEVDSFAAICPALEGRIDEERRSELRETLTVIGEEVRSGALTGLAKAGTTAAVGALLSALSAT